MISIMVTLKMFSDNHHVLQNISFIYLMFRDDILIKVEFTSFNTVSRVDHKYLTKVLLILLPKCKRNVVSCHWSLSIPPENIKKQLLDMFSGDVKKTRGMKLANGILSAEAVRSN